MPRQARIQYPGAMYHVMSRGNRRQTIYLGDVDRHDFLKTLGEACQKTGWQIHAFCLMSHHYHLVVEMRLEFAQIKAERIIGEELRWDAKRWTWHHGASTTQSSWQLRCACAKRRPSRSRKSPCGCTLAHPPAPACACWRSCGGQLPPAPKPNTSLESEITKSRGLTPFFLETLRVE
jgi:REP element-mobilizing transposase RayT